MTINDYLFANFKPKKESDLFCPKKITDILKNLFTTGIDIPILIHGPLGIGKKTALITMLKYIIPEKKKFEISDFEPMKTATSNDYSGLYRYNHIYYMNCKYFTNNELANMFNKLGPIFRSKSVFDSQKIFIITNIDTITFLNQQKLADAIGKYSTNVSFMLTSSSHKVIHKIKSSVFMLNHIPLTNKEFRKRFFSIFKYFFEDDEDLLENKTIILNKFYTIYCNNNYNIGNTLHHINFLYLSEKVNKGELNKKINLMSIYDKLAINLINSILKANEIQSYEVLKEKIYKMKSLTMNDTLIIKTILKHIIAIDKMDNDMKHKIVSLGTEVSEIMINTSKPVILLENFIIKLWAILKNNLF